MAKYILKRIAIAVIVLFGITIIDFFIMTLAGNPIEILSGGPRVNMGVLQQRAQNLGLDKPKYIQYFNWLGTVLHGDFGYSYKNYEPVNRMISEHIGPTLILMGTALLLSTLIAAVAGIYSAVHQHKAGDYIIQTIAFLGQSIPGFFLALILIYLFSVKLGVLPSGGMRRLGSAGSGIQWQYMIMPVIVLSVSMTGNNLRYIRSAMLEILQQDYLRTARAKGIGRFKVIYKHALRTRWCRSSRSSAWRFPPCSAARSSSSRCFHGRASDS
jgi:peptide/nickel transport system permease protein